MEQQIMYVSVWVRGRGRGERGTLKAPGWNDWYFSKILKSLKWYSYCHYQIENDGRTNIRLQYFQDDLGCSVIGYLLL